MKGTASQPHHTCRHETGKRSAQAMGMPSAGGVKGSKPHGRDLQGRGAQPAELDGGTPGRNTKICTLQLLHPTPPKTIHPDKFHAP
jgi:hypothetical protein